MRVRGLGLGLGCGGVGGGGAWGDTYLIDQVSAHRSVISITCAQVPIRRSVIPIIHSRVSDCRRWRGGTGSRLGRCVVLSLFGAIETTPDGHQSFTNFGQPGRDGGGGEGGYSFVACLSHLTIDHASLMRRGTVLTPDRDTSNIWVLSALLPYTTSKLFVHPIPVLFRRLRPPPIS